MSSDIIRTTFQMILFRSYFHVRLSFIEYGRLKDKRSNKLKETVFFCLFLKDIFGTFDF